MNAPQLVRFFHPDPDSVNRARIGVLSGDQVYDVSASVESVAAWLRASTGRVTEAIEELVEQAEQSALTFPAASFAASPSHDQPHWLAPVDTQEVWAAGVTYERSREARQQEAIDGGDIYARVYAAERPELFFKAHGPRVVGPGGAVGIRTDAAWSVPEPELGVMLNPALEVVGFTVGNDMSSRDIEGANPLYLPQAKVYTASCALGPGVMLQTAVDWPATTIRIMIHRAEQVVFEGEVHTRRIHRTLAELIEYLGRSNAYPDGVVLLTGTGIVPPDEFTLAGDDVVSIQIDGIGTLTNAVKVV